MYREILYGMMKYLAGLFLRIFFIKAMRQSFRSRKENYIFSLVDLFERKILLVDHYMKICSFHAFD